MITANTCKDSGNYGQNIHTLMPSTSSVRPLVPGSREALVQGLSPVDPYVIAALLIILKELLEILISSKHLFLAISAKCGLCHWASGVAQ